MRSRKDRSRSFSSCFADAASLCTKTKLGSSCVRRIILHAVSHLQTVDWHGAVSRGSRRYADTQLHSSTHSHLIQTNVLSVVYFQRSIFYFDCFKKCSYNRHASATLHQHSTMSCYSLRLASSLCYGSLYLVINR